MGLKNWIVNNKVELFTGFGISAVITGVLMACKNTMKVHDILEDHNKMREAIEKEEDPAVKRTETFKLYGYTAARFAGLYILPTALIAGGLGSCTYATKLSMDKNLELAEKNAALAAVAAGSESRFGKYRDRVIERYGKEVDESLMNPEEEYVEETTEVDEDGKKKKVKVKHQIVDPSKNLNKWTFYITRSNPNWNDDNDVMQFTFNCVEDSLNDDLNTKRADRRPTWLNVNDLRERLAVDPRRDLQFDGWVKDNYDANDVEKVVLSRFKKQMRGADGNLEDVWEITPNARPIYDEMV